MYLDFSKASMDIAQRRVNMRGLSHEIHSWINERIENIPKLGLGEDYINASMI